MVIFIRKMLIKFRLSSWKFLTRFMCLIFLMRVRMEIKKRNKYYRINHLCLMIWSGVCFWGWCIFVIPFQGMFFLGLFSMGGAHRFVVAPFQGFGIWLLVFYWYYAWQERAVGQYFLSVTWLYDLVLLL